MNKATELNIRKSIEASKERCRLRNLDTELKYSRKIIEGAALQRVLKRNRELIELSKPFIEHLYNFVKGSNFFTILTDESGCILNVIGDEGILEEAFAIKMIPGAYMDEENIGTNAMSLALTEKKPIQISGEDHYIKAYHKWTCSAAPIMDANNKLIGVLDLTGYYDSVNSHTLGMVVAAVNAIEKMLEIIEYNKKLESAKIYTDTIIDSIPAGIMTSDLDGNIITVNKHMLYLFGYTEEEMKQKKAYSLFEDWDNAIKAIRLNDNYLDEDVFVNSRKNVLQYNLSVYPIRDIKENLNGVVYVFKEVRKVRKLANKIMGRQAIYTFDKIIGNNKEFLKTIEFAKQIADSRSTILIMGESGTGKEVFAQSIHNYSNRRNETFVALNCGAIPKNLIESELFGYEEGAFTGAKKNGHPGKFEIADGGTIFLDEVGEMPLDMQTRLLRVIEEGTVCRIGSTKEIVVDVRIIAATNKDLVEEVNRGNFRKDLFYRLNVLPLRLPALRERKDDIPLLIDYFMNKISKRINKKVIELTKDYLKELIEYDWPGNIRELENLIELVLNTGCIDHNHIKSKKAIGNENYIDIEEAEFNLEKVEKEIIIKALKRFKGNITNCAKALGIGRNTLYRKISKYKIDCSEFEV
ncbi:sigma-54-dependent Fis family transcriptional regulator [Lutispora sp.]|uniref:sigma-54-dependent Fis family transcriptional regulator n=1 Tax=Lutispora sp. TaxID=2828727 RepID=UPI003566A30A